MSEKTAVEILREARELIARPGKWAQGYFAFDAAGDDRDPRSPQACKFCAWGAVMAAGGAGDRGTSYHVALNQLRAEVPGLGLSAFNDAPGRTQAEVVALFDAAIAKLEATR